MGENICKIYNLKLINLQNIQAACSSIPKQTNKKNISTQPNQKIEDLNKYFSKDITKKHMKRCTRSLIIREMQTKTVLRYSFTLVRVDIIKILQAINAGEGVKKGEPNPPTLLGM